MHSIKQIITVQFIVLFILIAFSAQTARAKSVYAIINHQSDIIGAYKIDANQIEYQKQIQAPQQGVRAIDLAIDSGSSCIFVTYESSNIIEIMNAKTLEHEGSVTAFGAADLAGIVFDEARQKLYTVDRGTNNLFVYFWNHDEKTLIPDGINPKILAYLGGERAHGIALDANSNHLYVADCTNIVHYYDTNNWNDVNYVNVGETAVDIDIDSERGYLYAGGYYYNDYLSRLNLSTGIAEANDIGAGVIGLAVDPNSGLVYTTTRNNQFRVYDTSTSPFTLTDYDDISAGCGVCVPSLDVTYKDPFPLVTLVKDDNDVDCAYPWNEIDENYLVYNICYDANGHADTNVHITDHLPVEDDYNSSDPCGYYDPCEHTVTWYIPVMSASDSNTYRIQVGVNYYAKPGHKITNLCEIESDLYYKYTTIDTNVCCYGGYIIYVDADANGFKNGTSWLHAYKDLQEALHTARTCGCEQIWVAEGTYKPTKRSARSTSFELIDGVAIYGGFPPGGGGWPQRNPNVYETILSGDIAALNDYNDNSYHVVKAVDVNNAVLDGFIITAGKADGSDANAYGGGIYFKDSTNLNVTYCNFSDNASYRGGGLYNDFSDLNINNCIFSNNSAYYGGAVFNDESEPYIINCIFTSNAANQHGGGIYSDDSNLNVTKCVFTGNTATASSSKGGGMYNQNGSLVAIANCIFSGNTSYDKAGGINNNYSGVSLTNCTVTGNSAWDGGGMRNVASSGVIVTNCIFWNNVVGEILNDSNTCSLNVYYSDVKGGWSGEGNIDKDPCFYSVEDSSGSWTENATYDSSSFQSTLTDENADWAVNELAGRFVNPDTNQALQFFIVSNDVNTINVLGNVESIAGEGDPYQIYDYHLTVDSVCIDAGYPQGDYTGWKDIDGEPRVFDGDANGTGIVDMGADEYYWSPADINGDGFVNFFDYAFFASAWQSEPNDPNYNEDCDLEDNNLIDYKDIALFCEDWLWQTAWAKAFPFAYETMGRGMGKSMGESPGLTQEPFPSVSSKQEQPELTAADIEEIIKWLEDLWLTNEEVRKTISADDWLKFIEQVLELAKQEI
jgi:hypothetical protein